MTNRKRINLRRFTQIMCVLAAGGLCGVYALAQIPSSGTTGSSSQSDSRAVRAVSTERSHASDKALSLYQDGWHTWKVDAVDNAPDWCCNRWHGKEVASTVCELDGGSHGISQQTNISITDEMQLYVKIDDGQTNVVKVFGANCGVISQSEITDHGKVTPAVSLDWLDGQLGKNQRLTGHALAAIAVHASDRAQRMINDAAHAKQPIHTRKQAIFWMGQVRARQSADQLARLMLEDDVEEIREHTVFSISQSDLPDRVALIVRSARNDRATKVRGQSWFWLSQTSEALAGQRILEGMQAESSQAVLKQAVFALSQLPDEEAIDALILVIEQPEYEREVRKQALFWMAQNGSDRAVAYLGTVLDR